MKNPLRHLPEKTRYFLSMLLTRLVNRGKPLRNITIKNILVFKQDEIGDLCYTFHVFSMLKAQYPNAHITLLCKPFAVKLAQNHPHINSVTASFSDLNNNYDLIVDLRGSWKSIWYAFTHWPAIRLDRGTVRFNTKVAKCNHAHEVITNVEILRPLIDEKNINTKPKIYTSLEDDNTVKQFLAKHQITRFALLHTGARKELRRWNQFDELASHLKNQLGFDVIFCGDNSDTENVAIWQNNIPFTTYSVAGVFNLSQFAALASVAQIFIGNESGPLHIAAVCNTPSVGLFGPGEPTVFYPWGNHTKYIHHVLSCNPCNQINCVQPQNPCINLITLNEVKHQINQLLN